MLESKIEKKSWNILWHRHEKNVNRNHDKYIDSQLTWIAFSQADHLHPINLIEKGGLLHVDIEEDQVDKVEKKTGIVKVTAKLSPFVMEQRSDNGML